MSSASQIRLQKTAQRTFTMSVRVLQFDRAKRMSWANGIGVTRQILRSPAYGTRLDWRVSVADVEQSGAFSRLPGIDRTIVFCEGNRMSLTINGKSVELLRGIPFEFSGDAATFCDVSRGSTRNLNIMVNRATAIAKTTVTMVNGTHTALTTSAAQLLVAITTGMATGAGTQSVDLERYDAVYLEKAGQVSISGSGSLLSIEFTPARSEPCVTRSKAQV